MEQHKFVLEVTTIERGETFEEAHRAAITTADRINNEILDIGRVVVRETDEHFLGDSDGVFCEGCEEGTIPGVRWPTSISSDTSNEWVERCDRCERYESDEEAARIVRLQYSGTGAVQSWGKAKPACSDNPHPFVNTE